VINEKYTPEMPAVFQVPVRTPWGCTSIFMTIPEIEKYNADPDAYAAAHFGLSVSEYVEWIELEGVALCGEKTRKGHPCKAWLAGSRPGPIVEQARQWKATHREFACPAHGGPRKAERGAS